MTEAKFLEGSILRHITVMTATASIGLMALFVVDLVDLYFLSLLGEVELAAAVGYAGSILFFTTSICIGLAIAMAALVARAVGARETARAKRYVVHVSLFALIVTVPLAVLVWLAIPDLLRLVGAEGRALELSATYLRIIVPSMPVLALAMASGGVLRAVGAARLAMSATLAGGLVNAVLDPILIFGLELGVAGAAWASLAARATVFLAGTYGVVVRVEMLGRFKARVFGRDAARIAAIAGPAVLTNVATPVGNAYVTASMAAFGDDAVAGFSIVGRIIPVAFGVIFALSGAVGPVIGQNYGAGSFARIRRALLDALLLSTAVVLVSASLLFLLQDQIAAAFGASPGAAAVWGFFASFIAVTFAFMGAQFVAHAAFNNLGRPLWSTWSNWGRATLGTIPLVWLGAAWLGPEGVLLGQAAGGVIFGAGAYLVAWWLCAVPERLGPSPTRTQMFRIPLSPLTVYRGWTGFFDQDRAKTRGEPEGGA
ncbi:MAG: MATE family efflux transporter [Kiloniellales bacterium]|nr:MATE family efflux transporter [Kiloniellales bacterium]